MLSVLWLSIGLSPPATPAAKAGVLSAIAANTRAPSLAARAAVLDAVQALEESGTGLTAPIEGRWALIYSTQTDERKRAAAPGAVQAVIDGTYALFFKFAPALAGAEEGGRRANNEQRVDLERGRACNRVRLSLPGGGQMLELTVNGEVAPAAPDDVSDLRVTFTDFTVGLASSAASPLKLPLPRPVGSLSTSFVSRPPVPRTQTQCEQYQSSSVMDTSRDDVIRLIIAPHPKCMRQCDDDMRVSRGGRGGVFVLRRLSDLDD